MYRTPQTGQPISFTGPNPPPRDLIVLLAILFVTFYGDRSLDLEGTRIPDPDVAHHLYLARPLADVAPEWVEPTSGLTLRDLALKLGAQGS